MSGSHGHHHHVDPDAGDRRVFWAVAVNVLLTVAQVVGGRFAGSLSLVADALHNVSNAVSRGIAFAARKIARRPSPGSAAPFACFMLGTPPDVDAQEVVEAIQGVDGVLGVHHLHVWAIDEQQKALEAHIVVAEETGAGTEAVKQRIKATARERFAIGHTTLELERRSDACCGEDAKVIGHAVEEGDAGHRH